MSLREEFVRLAGVEDANVSLLCRRFGVSRRTGYKWIGRYRTGGKAALTDRSRRPRASPSRSSEPIERAVAAVREQHPAWGPRKIHRVLRNDGHDPSALPAPSTIGQILLRHGLIDPAASADRRRSRVSSGHTPTSCGRWTSRDTWRCSTGDVVTR